MADPKSALLLRIPLLVRMWGSKRGGEEEGCACLARRRREEGGLNLSSHPMHTVKGEWEEHTRSPSPMSEEPARTYQVCVDVCSAAAAATGEVRKLLLLLPPPHIPPSLSAFVRSFVRQTGKRRRRNVAEHRQRLFLASAPVSQCAPGGTRRHRGLAPGFPASRTGGDFPRPPQPARTRLSPDFRLTCVHEEPRCSRFPLYIGDRGRAAGGGDRPRIWQASTASVRPCVFCTVCVNRSSSICSGRSDNVVGITGAAVCSAATTQMHA